MRSWLNKKSWCKGPQTGKCKTENAKSERFGLCKKKHMSLTQSKTIGGIRRLMIENRNPVFTNYTVLIIVTSTVLVLDKSGLCLKSISIRFRQTLNPLWDLSFPSVHFLLTRSYEKINWVATMRRCPCGKHVFKPRYVYKPPMPKPPLFLDSKENPWWYWC